MVKSQPAGRFLTFTAGTTNLNKSKLVVGLVTVKLIVGIKVYCHKLDFTIFQHKVRRRRRRCRHYVPYTFSALATP